MTCFAGDALAVIPTDDARNFAQNATIAANQMTQLLQQVQQLRSLLSISTIANAVLGPDSGAGWGQFFDSVSGLYNEVNTTASMVNSIPYDINRQMSIFSPPQPGTGIGGIVWKIKEVQSLLNEHNLHAIAMQSTLTRANAEAARKAAEGGQQILRSKGQLEAQQLSGVMLGNIEFQLSGMGQTLSSIDLRDAIKDQDEAVKKAQRDELHQLAMEELQTILGKGAGTISQNPINWGR